MKKKHISAILGLTTCFAANGIEAQERPNIIIIMVDDMGFSDIGCYGGEIHTPTIDRLANDGVHFTQYYSNSRSCPTRASLLTGKYSTNADIGQMSGDSGIDGYRGFLDKGSLTMGEVFKHAGYQTFLSGKWHVGMADGQWPYDRGYSRSFTFLNGATDFYEPVDMAIDNQSITITDPDFYMTHAISDHAVSFIKESSASKDPFYMYVAYTAPHWPLQAPKEMIDKYYSYYECGWDKIRETRFEQQKKLGLFSKDLRLPPRHQTIPSWASLSQAERAEWTTKMAIYAAMIDIVDQGIGQIVKQLEDQKIMDNTVIMFTSDNGACPWPYRKDPEPGSVPGLRGSAVWYGPEWANASNTPYGFFKRYTHEGGVHVPLIVHYPQMKSKGVMVNALAHVTDIMPTCMDIAAVEYPKTFQGMSNLPGVDGISFKDVLSKKKSSVRESLCFEHNGNRAVRKGNLKLLYNYDKGARVWELYDLEKDPFEEKNIADQNSEIVKSLIKEYDNWASENGVIEYSKLMKMKKIN